jgi:hypothetical protein
VKLIRLLAAIAAGAATLILLRRRPGRLRLDRARRRIPALDRRIEMTCSLSLEPDM